MRRVVFDKVTVLSSTTHPNENWVVASLENLVPAPNQSNQIKLIQIRSNQINTIDRGEVDAIVIVKTTFAHPVSDSIMKVRGR